MTKHTANSLPAWQLLGLLALAFQPLTAHSAEPASPFPRQLPPAEAKYRVTVNGIPVGLTATIRLTQDPQQADHYQLHFKVRNRLFQHEEIAQFEWRNCQARSHHYRHATSGFGINREGEIKFDWQQSQAIGSKAVYALSAQAMDALSVAMMARCNMAKDEQAFSYAVAEPDGMEEYQYRTLGKENLETPAGHWNSTVVERDYPERNRNSKFWAAQELDYFMVRMDHQENLFVRGKIEMTDFRYLDAGLTSDAASPSPERQDGSTVTSR